MRRTHSSSSPFSYFFSAPPLSPPSFPSAVAHSLFQFSKCPTANWVAVVAARGGASGEGAESQGRRAPADGSALLLFCPDASRDWAALIYFDPSATFLRPWQVTRTVKAFPFETPPTSPLSAFHWSLQHQGEERAASAANKKGRLIWSASKLSFLYTLWPQIGVRRQNCILGENPILFYCVRWNDEDHWWPWATARSFSDGGSQTHS